MAAGDYADERCAPSVAELAVWPVHVRYGHPDNTSGRCPHCGDQCQVPVPTMVVSTQLAAGLVAGDVAAAAPPTLTRQIHCTCTAAHQRPAGISFGCGRWWLATFVRRPDATWVMTPAIDDSLLSTAQAVDAALVHEREEITGAAQKWLGGVTALYGLFGLTGIAVGKDTVSALATWAAVLVGLALLIGVGSAAVATVWAYQAAYGWPRVDTLADDEAQRVWKQRYDAYGATAARLLRQAVQAAGGALAALLVATGLIWFGARASPPATTLTVFGVDGASTCGTLLNSDPGGSVRVRQKDGSVVARQPAQVARITVGACPT